MKNYIYLFFAFITITFGTMGCVKDELLISDTPDVATSPIKLNEIMSTGEPDWVELFNSSSEAIDLSGYKISDSGAEWTIDNLTILAGGYVSFDCDKGDISNVSTNFKISSGGEEITLFNEKGELIDQITTPDMAAQIGLAYGRESDGADNWVVLGASRGAANSNENDPPLITVDELTEFTEIYEASVSDANGISSVNLVLKTEGSVQSLDMGLIDGKYQTSLPDFEVGTKVEYYIKATDNTGMMSFYPETAPGELLSYYVTGGDAIFLSVDYAGANDGNRGLVTFDVEAFDNEGVSEVKLYYVTPGVLIDDKVSVILDLVDGAWTGVIPEQAEGTVVQYYLRATNEAGSKVYYPTEDGSFDHDDLASWPSYRVGDAVVIINGFSLFTNSDAVAGSDLEFKVHVKYDNGPVEEVKFYYIINYDPVTYDEATDRVDIEWGGTIPTTDNFYNFSIPSADFIAGDKISWYMRAKDGAGDKQYFTVGQSEDFDKDVIDDWNVITIK